MANPTNTKPTLGFFELTSCKGCEQQVLNANLALLDIFKQVKIAYWPALSSKEVPSKLDIAIVEGAISSPEQEEFVKTLRENAKCIIALGACACGLDDGKNETFKAVHDVVKVDHYVRCCPIDTRNFIDVLQSAIGGRNTFISTATLCGECKSNEKGCFFGRGKLCDGLLTVCGCDAKCTNFNVPCRGCAGISPVANEKTAEVVAKESSKQDFQAFRNVCSIERFLNKNLDGLKDDDAAFVASRFDGKNSEECMLCALETFEKEDDVQVNAHDANLRECLRLASRAQNHVTQMIFTDLRQIKGYADLPEFYTAEPEFVEKALKLRLAMTNILTVIGGRAVHAITCVKGGFSIKVDDAQLENLIHDLNSSEEFAKSLIDVFSHVWKNSILGSDPSPLNRVLTDWDNLTDEARFGAAKASLRPPETDTRKTCIACAIEVVDALERIKELLL